jgi:hypothetical protein
MADIKWRDSLASLYQVFLKHEHDLGVVMRILTYEKPWSTLIVPLQKGSGGISLALLIHHYKRVLNIWKTPLDQPHIIQLELLYAWLLNAMTTNRTADSDSGMNWLINLRYLATALPSQEPMYGNVFFLLICFAKLSLDDVNDNIYYQLSLLVNKERNSKWCKAYPRTALFVSPPSMEEIRTRQMLEERRLEQEQQKQMMLLMKEEESRKLREQRFAAIKKYEQVSLLHKKKP